MKLSTGKVAFPIEFDNGDKQSIYFNPNDRETQNRIKKFEENVQKRIDSLDAEKKNKNFNSESLSKIDNIDQIFDMDEEELSDLQNSIDVIDSIESEYNKAICEELDVVFDSKVSDIIFKYCQPLNIVVVEDEKGNETREMYIMHFLRWFANELKKYGEKNKGAMEKHLAKYRK